MADARPPLGHGRSHADRQDLHPGTSGVAQGLHTIEFLKYLIRHVGPRLLVVWDGSPIHRRKEVEQFLASAIGHGVRVERLPPYAPDLNPVEGAWQHLKHVEMRNLVCLDLEELHLELYGVVKK